jgi:UPF0271 protein
MKLNCDLGESYGAWQMGQDDAVMPLIDMANVACGFHAADPMVIRRTVALAAQHEVEIGAHPSYHDLAGFGRRSIAHSAEEIHALMLYQMGALDGMCRAEKTHISYVKPHGALNNDMMRDDALLRAVAEAVHDYRHDLPLMMPVSCRYREQTAIVEQAGVPVLLEAFADRAYTDEGLLVPRAQQGAVHTDTKIIVDQALSFAEKGGVFSINGRWLDLPAHSLCVHGDNESALDAVRSIREALKTPAT